MGLAPTQLGGSVTYVIVDGNSMEPHFLLGDLLLVRTEPAYSEGDAVVYRNAEMSKYVFHRILGTDLNHFILKGDHNSWQDSYQPVQDEIVGKLWVHIPKLGKVLEIVRLPINMALAVALLGGVLMSGMFINPTKNGGEKRSKPLNNSGGMQAGGLYLFAFLAFAFLGLTIFSFTRPLTSSATNISYQQEGYFFYSATGTPGVYDTELVRSGEPVFPKLTCFLNVGFTYNVLADQIQSLSGSQQLYARVLDEQSGWQRTIPLYPQTGFSGGTYSAMATLDLCQVESLVALVEQETGLHPNTYTLEIVADVAVTGSIAGNPLNDTFTPSLAFNFDKAHFYLANTDPQVDSLHTVKPGLTGGTDLQANTFSIFGLNPTVRSIRVAALLGFGFSLITLCAMGMYFYRAAQQSPQALIQLKYGGMLVDVFDQDLVPTSSTIDVTTMENLAKLAERHGTMILHMSRNFLHYYLVQASGITYRHVISSGRKGNAETESVGNVEIKPVVIRDERASHNTEPGLALNKYSQSMAIPAEPMEFAADFSGNNSANFKTELAWKQIQTEAADYLASHTDNPGSDMEPLPLKEPEYVIQSGEISCYTTEPSDVMILRKIKL